MSRSSSKVKVVCQLCGRRTKNVTVSRVWSMHIARCRILWTHIKASYKVVGPISVEGFLPGWSVRRVST